MALETRGWRRRPVALTPLIDIIFLLLLFFMLSSTFTRFAEVPLSHAGGGRPGTEPPLFLQLRAEDLTLNGVPVALDAVVPAVKTRAAGADVTVLVALSPGVTSQRLVDLLSRLRNVADLAVRVLG